MPCFQFDSGTTITLSNRYRIRVEKEGYRKYVYMEWMDYCGPTFYHDRACDRWYQDWYEDDDVNYAFVQFANKYHDQLYKGGCKHGC